MNYTEIPFGFTFGPVQVERWISDEKKGWVVIGLITARGRYRVYVTRSGKVRFFREPPARGEYKLEEGR